MQIKIFKPGSLGFKRGSAFQESEWQIRDKERGFSENKVQYFIFNCIEEGSLKASSAIKMWGGVFQIQSFIVGKKYRGEGIGKKLLQKIISEAINKKCHQVYVSTLSTNKDSIKMYKNTGFKLKGKIKNTFFDQSLIILTKQLPNNKY